MHIVIKGFILGFSIAAIVGPITVLCIQRTITDGKKYGFVSGLGAAVADTLYAAVAVFGLVFISSVLINNQLLIRVIGGVVLLCIGINIFFSKPVLYTPTHSTKKSLASGFGSTLLLTITNPMTILSFVAAYVGFGISTEANHLLALIFVMSVFVGSMVWWFILVWVTSLIKNTLNPDSFRWINRGAGILIFGFGVFSLLSNLV